MATFTITTPGAQDARILSAIGERLGLGDGAGNFIPATGPQVKQWIIDRLQEAVLEVEQARARVAAQAGVTPVTPT